MVDKKKPEPLPESLTISEAAHYLGCDISTLSRAIRTGRLHTMPFKHLKLIPRAEVERYKVLMKPGRPVGWRKKNNK